MSRFWRALAPAACLALGLAGCGGSDGDGSPGRDTTPPAVSAKPAGGAFDGPQTVTLTAADDTDASPAIYYTTDGTEATAASTPYTSPIEVKADTTLRFVAIDAAQNAAAGTETYDLVEASVSGAAAVAQPEFVEIAARLDAVLNIGYNTTNPDVVMKRLSGLGGGDPTSLVVIDTREPADYATGHIPGAVNIPLKTLPQALLEGDPRIPMDKEIVVASYWGNDGNMASLLINLYRIADPAQPAAYPKSTALFQGMTSWSFERSLVPAGTRFNDSLGLVRVERPTVAGAVTAPAKDSVPQFEAFAAERDTVVDKILVRANEYLNSVGPQTDLQAYPTALAANLDDGDAANDPQIISVRSDAHFAAGHIPGAINIGWKAVAKPANYVKIDPSKPAVVYCYTGHTGALATMALGILGYDVKNMLYGMNGWSTTAPGQTQFKNFDLEKGFDFPLDTDLPEGVELLADYDPPSAGCVGCHTSLTALWVDLVEVPLSAGVAPPSEGEG